MMVRPTLVRFLAVSVVALILAACRDTSGPLEHRTIVPRDRSATISDGAHHNGNDDVFFLPPMVANPQGVPGYGDPFQPGLPIAFVIRDQTAGGAVLRTLAGTVQDESYQANWDTKADNLIASHVYRIEVAIAQKVVAFADVIVGANGSALKNVNTNDNIALIDGRTLPVKVRVEKGWNCVNNASCTTQVVSNSIPTGQMVIVKSPDGNNMAAFSGAWFDPQQAGTNVAVVTIEDVSSQLLQQPGGCSVGATNENARGLFGLSSEYCVRISVDPHVILTQPVVVATCRTNPGDERQLLMKYDVNEAPKFLNESAPPAPCPVNIGSTVRDKNPIKRLAAAVFSGAGTAINWALGVKPAYAIHLGVGGIDDIGDSFSLFTLGLPAEMESVAGDQQSGLAGAALPVKPRVRVVAVHDVSPATAGVTNAGVTCQVTSGTGGGFVVNNQLVPSAAATELPTNDGTYECPAWVLSQTPGTNTLRVTSARLDTNIVANLDGTIVRLPGTVTFSATGSQVSSVTVNPPAGPLSIGGHLTLSAAVSPNTVSQAVTWSTSDPTIVTVDQNGQLTGVSAANATVTATSVTDPSKSATVQVSVLPNPAIHYTGSEQYLDAFSNPFDRYSFDVTNRSSYPASMFTTTPGPCGSRTTVDIYDNNNNRIYGFCALSDPSQMVGLWFAEQRWTSPPAGFYITLTDQVTHMVFKSNTVNLYGPIFTNFPRTLTLNWAPVQGATAYRVVMETCNTWGNPDWTTNCVINSNLTFSDIASGSATSFDVTFVADNVGRFRIQALDANSNVISTTADKYFRFMTPPNTP